MESLHAEFWDSDEHRDFAESLNVDRVDALRDLLLLAALADELFTLEERVEAMVEHRATLYERCSPYIRANHRLRDRSEFLAGRFRQLVLQLRELLLRWLPELHDASPELVEALDQSTSFEAWDRLRIDQQLSRARAQASMHFAASALVAQLDDSR